MNIRPTRVPREDTPDASRALRLPHARTALALPCSETRALGITHVPLHGRTNTVRPLCPPYASPRPADASGKASANTRGLLVKAAAPGGGQTTLRRFDSLGRSHPYARRGPSVSAPSHRGGRWSGTPIRKMKHQRRPHLPSGRHPISPPVPEGWSTTSGSVARLLSRGFMIPVRRKARNMKYGRCRRILCISRLARPIRCTGYPQQYSHAA